MNRYPMNQQAQQMAQYGRQGDSTLMHVNPQEVQGIAALAGTNLTINPYTGLPEAFELKNLIPMIAGTVATIYGGPMAGAAVSGLSTTAVTGDIERGIASGLMSYGIGSAMGAAGDVGANLATDAAAEAATQAATDAAISGTTDVLTGAIQSPIAESALADPLAQMGTSAATNVAAQSPAAINPLIGMGSSATPGMAQGIAGNTGSYLPTASQVGFEQTVSEAAPTASGRFANNASNMWEGFKADPQAAMQGLGTKQLMMGAYGHASLDQQDDAEQRAKDYAEEKKRKRAFGQYLVDQAGVAADRYYAEGGIVSLANGGWTSDYMDEYRLDPFAAKKQAMLTGKYNAPPANYMHGFMPEWDFFTNDETLYESPNPGNDVVNPGDGSGVPDYQRPYDHVTPGGTFRDVSRGLRFNDVMQDPLNATPWHRGDYNWLSDLYEARYGQPPQARVPGATGPNDEEGNSGLAQGGIVGLAAGGKPGDKIDPANPRNAPVIPPENQYQYWQSPEFGNFSPAGVYYPGTLEMQPYETWYPSTRAHMQELPFFRSFATGNYEPPPMRAFAPAGGGATGGGTDGGMAEGGIAQLAPEQPQMPPQGMDMPMGPPQGQMPPQSLMGPQQNQPQPQEIELLALAILGETEQADQIINAFIELYGQEMFQRLRDAILQNVVPGAQTEGKIEGQGGGMDDQVPGMIGNQQPVAVSPGEYIVPADVVSGLGDGSSEAGAQELDGMMDRVRKARGGSLKQPPAIDENKVLPR